MCTSHTLHPNHHTPALSQGEPRSLILRDFFSCEKIIILCRWWGWWGVHVISRFKTEFFAKYFLFRFFLTFHLQREHGVPDMCVSLTQPNGRLLVINGQKKMCVSCMTVIKSRSLFYFSFLQARIQWRLIASNLHSNYKHETPLKVSFCFIFINSQLKQLECRDDYCMSVFRLRVSLFWVSFFFVVVTRRRCCFGWWSTCDVCDVTRFKSSYGTLHKIYSFFVFLIFFVAFALCGAPSEHNVWKTVACCFSPKKVSEQWNSFLNRVFFFCWR